MTAQMDVPPKSSTQLLEYDTSHSKRGLAIIFNQETFDFKMNLSNRRGSTTDKENLTKRFQELGFEVDSHDNLSVRKMWKILNQAAERDYTDADCFVCIFLSHGEDGHIFARDGKVDLKEVTDHFKGEKCKSLVGKPKIFIFQACRGKKPENAVTPMTGGDSDEEEEGAIYTLPAGADFLMCYCVSEGYAAFRHVEHGSFYIQDLCESLRQEGSALEITEILTLVNLKVSRRSHNNKKQMPCFTSFLTKKLYFRPKE